jgi:modification methylase
MRAAAKRKARLDEAFDQKPDLSTFLPSDVRQFEDVQTAVPRIAKDAEIMGRIEKAVQTVPTEHLIVHADSRFISEIEDESVQLVLTSPPYWTLKEYRDSEGQLGHIEDYESFLAELDKVWFHCFRVLVPGGRLICVVGDVCLSRRENGGRHTVIALHSSIQEHCRKIGFDNLAPTTLRFCQLPAI